MRKIILALAGLALVACAPPLAPPGRSVIVKNSLWQDVPLDSIGASPMAVYGAKALGPGGEVSDSELLDIVDEYNAETMDDFLRVYYDEAPDIDSAPPVNVFIVNPFTYEVNSAAYGITRRALIDDIELWRLEAFGQILFIDHVPPMPIVEPPASMYAFYALYVIDESGVIVYEDHCGWTASEVWEGDWIIAGGWRDADHYRETTYNAYRSIVGSHPGWALVEHALYAPPSE